MAELKELLAASSAVDLEIRKHAIAIGKAVINVPAQVNQPIPPVHELKLDMEDVDPFGGNINNRNVAKRVAGQNRKLFHNTHQVTHNGDPGKAARDIEKSMAVNPDAMSDAELELAQQRETAAKLAEKTGKVPTAGSPADQRKNAAEAQPKGEAATGAKAPATQPAPWVPNAGAAR